MEFLDLHNLVGILSDEQGHGAIQTILLAMIWWSARGVKKELGEIKKSFSHHEIHDDGRFGSIEKRLTKLETKGA